MKSKLFLFILVLINFQIVSSQVKDSLKSNLFKINILTPGFTFENASTKNTSISFELGLSYGFSMRNNSLTSNKTETTLIYGPYIKTQYRYYYNLAKRVEKRKSIHNNSGGYLALNSSYYFKPINNENYINVLDGFNLAGVWGFQKTYKSNLNLGANLGLGYNFSEKVKQDVVPIINFTLGWVIGK